MVKKQLIMSFVSAVCALTANAELHVARPFTDNMVLQRNAPVKIWGTSAPNAKITVALSKGAHAAASADANGNWIATLPMMKASFDPQTMTVRENGADAKTFSNILVGEVWIMSGQSNMAYSFKSSSTFDADKPSEEIKGMRLLKLPYWSTAERKTDFPQDVQWVACDAKTLPSSSGVGYYFARKLMDELNVPVGMMQAACGGSYMSAWTPRWALLENPALAPDCKKFDAERTSYNFNAAKAEWDKKKKAFDEVCAKAKTEGKPKPPTPWYLWDTPSPFSPRIMRHSPYIFYHNAFAPINRMAIGGVLWYQGEDDSEWPWLFQTKFTSLINSWRRDFGRPDLPFVYAQLPSFEYKNNWVAVREAQRKTARELKNVHYANLLDTGEQHDIHPKDKRTVGTRLGSVALDSLFGGKNGAIAPEFKSFKSVSDNRAEVGFETFGHALAANGDAKGFEVLVDGKWKPATASIKSADTVSVSSADAADARKRIEGVRYLYKNWALPEVWLYNDKGTPANFFTSSAK